MYRIALRRLSAATLLMLFACVQQNAGIANTATNIESTCTIVSDYAAWKKGLYKEAGENGAVIVDYDTPLFSEADLYQYYANQVAAAKLIIHQNNGMDAKWSAAQQNQLTYCISGAFGSQKSAVIQAMADSTAAWHNAGDVNYQYLPAEDTACSSSNDRVLFDVQPASGGGYLARAFFPYAARSGRSIFIDDSAFRIALPLTLAGVLRHELGHTLGFRHEQTRPNANACFEDNSWRPLTPYDSSSVMHYPHCNGTGDWSLTLTAYDVQGIRSAYGDPGASAGDANVLRPNVVAGNVAGLAAGQTLDLQNQQYDLITVSGNGTFSFPNQHPEGTAYEVVIHTQPVGQICTLANGSGVVQTTNPTMITVSCVSRTALNPQRACKSAS